MSNSEKVKLWKGPARAGTEFPDHVIKSSRKGFGLGACDGLDNLPSRPDFYYSWGKKVFRIFCIRPLFFF